MVQSGCKPSFAQYAASVDCGVMYSCDAMCSCSTERLSDENDKTYKKTWERVFVNLFFALQMLGSIKINRITHSGDARRPIFFFFF